MGAASRRSGRDLRIDPAYPDPRPPVARDPGARRQGRRPCRRARASLRAAGGACDHPRRGASRLCARRDHAGVAYARPRVRVVQPAPRDPGERRPCGGGAHPGAGAAHRRLFLVPALSPDRAAASGPGDDCLARVPAGGVGAGVGLFGPIGCQGGGRFANGGIETLFEAAGRCAVDWDGRSSDSAYDLSSFVRADHGYFESRDELFARLGQTLCAPLRVVVDPIARRIAA